MAASTGLLIDLEGKISYGMAGVRGGHLRPTVSGFLTHGALAPRRARGARLSARDSDSDSSQAIISYVWRRMHLNFRKFPCWRLNAHSAGQEAGAFSAFEEDPAQRENDELRSLLAWLLANGAEGIGSGDSRLGIYLGARGERGVLCDWDFLPGEVLATVPLRVALTDHPDDEESNALLYPDAPWSVRLACKLLRERAKGDASPWKSYISSLPKAVPAPLECFSWAEIEAIDYAPMRAAIDQAAWLASDAYARLSKAATAGATRDELAWALSVVHSRTFGAPAKGGGVGVRMLVPFVDLLNHGGDMARLRPFDSSEPLDHVEWRLVGPSSPANSSGEWQMHIVALRGCEAGDEVLLSYGERANDDFFLHYGFVPDSNPHDSVDLFPSMEALVEAIGDAKGAEARERAVAAVAEVERDVEEHGEGHMLGRVAEGDPFARGLKVLAGNRVDRRITSALAAAAGWDPASGEEPGEEALRQADEEIGERCLEVLGDFRTGLLADLAFLAGGPDAPLDSMGGWEPETEEEWRRMRWQAMHQYYSAAIGRFVQERGMTPGTSAEGLGSTAGDASAGVRDGVSGEEAEPAGASPRIATASSPSAGGSAASAGADSDAPSGAGDIASPVVLEDPRTMAAQLGIPLNSLSMGLSGEGVEEEGWEQDFGGEEDVRRESMVLIKSYLAWKKAILWDLVLATWPVSETA